MIMPYLLHILIVAGLSCWMALFAMIVLGAKCKIWPLVTGGIGFLAVWILILTYLDPAGYTVKPLWYAIAAGGIGVILFHFARHKS